MLKTIYLESFFVQLISFLQALFTQPSVKLFCIFILQISPENTQVEKRTGKTPLHVISRTLFRLPCHHLMGVFFICTQIFCIFFFLLFSLDLIQWMIKMSKHCRLTRIKGQNMPESLSQPN